MLVSEDGELLADEDGNLLATEDGGLGSADDHELTPEEMELRQGVESIIQAGDRRESKATVRKLQLINDSWIAMHEPQGGRAVPAMVAPGKVVNFKRSKVTVRGHLYRRNGRPVAFEVTDVLDGGSATTLEGHPGSGQLPG
ncbi:hypothetical protein KRR38_07100 [Novosphingobium sp. G106]|uniref:hypothetical protein n=1 Tax=Novosphingobium sp. G106 TaxID=2849500 RepID=UPI001C2D6423|nr:hypothetical protein [Novosphingobium sp. G106]MBV1687448.1 hypothetical protein [Novosphingobium sp. G106]